MHTVSRRLAAVLIAFCTAPAFAAPVFSDDFSRATSGWPNMQATRDSDLGFAVYTDSGRYQLTPVHDHTFGFIAAPTQAAGGDVRVEADLFLYAGIGRGAAGLACRFQDHRNFYGFLARGDAGVVIVKVRDGNATVLAQGTVASVMPGAVDTRLTAECSGDTLRLATKGGKAISARDTEFTGGKTGLVVIGEKLAGTSGMFDNFVLTATGAR